MDKIFPCMNRGALKELNGICKCGYAGVAAMDRGPGAQAAQYHLMVDIHDAYHPTGLEVVLIPTC